MDIQINELRNGEKMKEHASRYNLRSKKNEEKIAAPNQPIQKKDSSKIVTVSSKEKDFQNPQVLIRNPFPKTNLFLLSVLKMRSRKLRSLYHFWS